MMSYNMYPNFPSALLGDPQIPQVAYHLNMIHSKRRGLIDKDQKYTKILGRLTWLNACSSSQSIATGISSVAAFATFIGLPVRISLGAASLTGAIVSGIISALTKTYQKKLKKVTKLIDIIMPALVVFERVVSNALKNGVINEEELSSIRFRLYTLKHLTN